MWDLNLHFTISKEIIIVSKKLEKNPLILALIVAAVLIKANISPAFSMIYKHVP